MVTLIRKLDFHFKRLCFILDWIQFDTLVDIMVIKEDVKENKSITIKKSNLRLLSI